MEPANSIGALQFDPRDNAMQMRSFRTLVVIPFTFILSLVLAASCSKTTIEEPILVVSWDEINGAVIERFELVDSEIVLVELRERVKDVQSKPGEYQERGRNSRKRWKSQTDDILTAIALANLLNRSAFDELNYGISSSLAKSSLVDDAVQSYREIAWLEMEVLARTMANGQSIELETYNSNTHQMLKLVVTFLNGNKGEDSPRIKNYEGIAPRSLRMDGYAIHGWRMEHPGDENEKYTHVYSGTEMLDPNMQPILSEILGPHIENLILSANR